MVYNIVYEVQAAKQLKKLPKNIAAKILDYMDEIALLEQPSQRGKPLSSNLAGYWRYRVGDYRVVCKIENEILLIAVIKLGHRKDIYE